MTRIWLFSSFLGGEEMVAWEVLNNGIFKGTRFLPNGEERDGGCYPLSEFAVFESWMEDSCSNFRKGWA